MRGGDNGAVCLASLNSVGNLCVVTHSVSLELLEGNSIFDKISLENINILLF